jgi:hypothetical protein
MQAFWFVRQTETLLYIREQIKGMPAEQEDVGSLDFRSDGVSRPIPLLDLLGAFYGTSHFTTALDLALEIFATNARCLPNVFHILKKGYGFRPDSYLLDFAPQRAVIDRLWVRAENGQNALFTRLFLAIATHYLRTHFEVTESKKMSVSFTRFDLHSTPALIALRRSIWQHIFSLYTTTVTQAIK